MNEYETEEQQVAALKKWWKENSSTLIIGLLIGVSALYGWRYYAEQNNVHAVQASDLYMQIAQSVTLQTIDDKTLDINNKLINDYSDTPYAALSSLALAKYEYEKNNIENAAAQLELAIKHANEDTVKQIARLRLIRIYIEQKKYTEAETILNSEHDSAYDAQFAELKGDVYSAQGNLAQARVAYDEAIKLQGFSASKWLKLKRQNLGA
ncbi:MAG: hypothetical protein COB77_04345 [Gammaproteobacteria bacterium]|nr:MAG: hypothetical protein COB77_04345 [Gammaproteobacteria bacterium]